MTRDDSVDGGLRHELASDDHGSDTGGIADIDERVRIQQHQVGALPNLDGTLRSFAPEKAGRVDRRGLKSFQGSEPGFGQPFELIVQAKTRNHTIAPGEKTIAMHIQVVNRLKTQLVREAKFVESLRADV